MRRAGARTEALRARSCHVQVARVRFAVRGLQQFGSAYARSLVWVVWLFRVRRVLSLSCLQRAVRACCADVARRSSVDAHSRRIAVDTTWKELRDCMGVCMQAGGVTALWVPV